MGFEVISMSIQVKLLKLLQISQNLNGSVIMVMGYKMMRSMIWKITGHWLLKCWYSKGSDDSNFNMDYKIKLNVCFLLEQNIVYCVVYFEWIWENFIPVFMWNRNMPECVMARGRTRRTSVQPKSPKSLLTIYGCSFSFSVLPV